MSKIVKSACPLDCFDACGILATVEDGRLVKAVGDPDHPITKGFICHKGRAHVDRMYSEDRLKKPLLKTNGHFREISWQDAIDLIVEKLKDTLDQQGSQAILHNYDCGYSGISKSVDTMFFNHLGGVSTPGTPGSLCWKAGNVAQTIDFGTSKGHSAKDLENTNYMIVWGRNPAVTNIHFLQAIRAVKAKGGQVVCIDPFKTQTAKMSSWHLPIKPGGDGALAFAMAKIILSKGLEDVNFINNHTLGYQAYKQEVMNFDLKEAKKLTGLPLSDIEKLAVDYAQARPGAIVLGYGMQRYVNGGQNVRAINALGAITGNIGLSGGGVTYSNKSISKYVAGDVDASEVYGENTRHYKPAELGKFINTVSDPEIKFAWIAKANPVVQAPNTNEVLRGLRKIEFVVVVDMFMTDTAKEADLVLPATSIFEEADFIYSSMYSPYLCYAEKCVDAPDEMIGEYDLFRILARKMDLKTYPDIPRETFFKNALAPLIKEFNLEYEALKKAPYAIPSQEVPWSDKNFLTPSGKFEFASQVAEDMGLNKVIALDRGLQGQKDYPFRLITPHDIRSTNSQHFRDHTGAVEIFVPVEAAKENGFDLDEKIKVSSEYGQLIATVKPDGAMPQGVVKIMEGTWLKDGAVNVLVGDKVCSFGDQAAYYDTFVKLTKINFDN
ncbi:molybdopterin-containing oxidoreductase family protein [Fusibacter sp. JL216-2]|uniref:molybdopterin-containing oxidoreductase family protein n=1 Tax=Fusibacter sp. JL216-2 TaxID=3071453 RepID=UPI003D34C842